MDGLTPYIKFVLLEFNLKLWSKLSIVSNTRLKSTNKQNQFKINY